MPVDKKIKFKYAADVSYTRLWFACKSLFLFDVKIKTTLIEKRMRGGEGWVERICQVDHSGKRSERAFFVYLTPSLTD